MRREGPVSVRSVQPLVAFPQENREHEKRKRQRKPQGSVCLSRGAEEGREEASGLWGSRIDSQVGVLAGVPPGRQSALNDFGPSCPIFTGRYSLHCDQVWSHVTETNVAGNSVLASCAVCQPSLFSSVLFWVMLCNVISTTAGLRCLHLS